MRELRTLGSVRGALSNGCLYRDSWDQGKHCLQKGRVDGARQSSRMLAVRYLPVGDAVTKMIPVLPPRLA